MKPFVNFSNHPSANWSHAQISAATSYGDIVDIPFPTVPAEISSDEISAIADAYAARILGMDPSAVMCQGEFTLAFAVAAKLAAQNVTVLAACSKRKVTETATSDATQKLAVYEFVQFREYHLT